MSNIYPKSQILNSLKIESNNPIIPIPDGTAVADVNIEGGVIVKKGILLDESNDINPMNGLITYDKDESALKVYHNMEKFGIVMDTISQSRYDDISVTTTSTSDTSIELDIGSLQHFNIDIDPVGTTRFDISFDATNLKSSETTSWYNLEILINNSSSSEKGHLYFDEDTVLISSKLSYQTDGSQNYFVLTASSNTLIRLIYKDKSTVYITEKITFE